MPGAGRDREMAIGLCFEAFASWSSLQTFSWLWKGENEIATLVFRLRERGPSTVVHAGTSRILCYLTSNKYSFTVCALAILSSEAVGLTEKRL